jgi:hypothetical protein
LFLLSSCYYDVEEELYGTTECNLSDITYSTTVLPIIEDNCYRCHDAANNFGGITLEGYERLKTMVDNGNLLGVIRHEAGFSSMPKNEPALLDCEIEKIEAWVNAGAPNN